MDLDGDGNSTGHWANLQVTALTGAQVMGWRFDADTGVGATGAQDGSGIWTAAAGQNWHSISTGVDNNNWSNDGGEDAVFGAGNGTAGTVTLAGTINAYSLTFQAAGSGNYILSGGTLTLNAGGILAETSATIASTVKVAQSQYWTVVKDQELNITGVVDTTASLNKFVRQDVTKDGQGTLVLAGENTWNANLNVIGGLVVQKASQTFVGQLVAGISTIPSVLRLDADTTYQVTAGTLKFGNLSFAGGLAVPYYSATYRQNEDAVVSLGTLRLSSITGSASAPELWLAASDIDIRTKVLLDAGRHFINNDGVTKITGNVSGAGGITLYGNSSNNRLSLGGGILTSLNTFTGDIEIRRGSLHVVGETSLQGNNVLRFNVASGDTGRFYLRGFDRSVKDLSSDGAGSAIIANAPGSGFVPSNLIVTQNNDGTFGGTLVDTLNDGGGSGSAGALGLIKQGDATLTLTGNNTNTGLTTISAGTLQIGAGGTTGALGGGSVVNNAALVYNRSNAAGYTVSNAISGTGTLAQAGTGTLIQTGVDTRSGNTLVSGGTLRGGANNVFSPASTYALSDVAVATLDLNGTNQSIGALSGGGALGGNVTLGGGTLTVGAKNADATYSGVISGPGSLVKTGAGTQTLTRAQTYTGGTAVNNGALRLDFSDGTATADILTAIGALTLGGGTLEVKGGSGATNTQSINGITLTANTGSVLRLTQNGATSVDLRLGDITVGTNATVDFQGGTVDVAGTPLQGARFSFTTVNGDSVATGARLGAFATWNGTDWAANSGITDGNGGTYVGVFSNYFNVYNGTNPGPTVIRNNAGDDVRINEAAGDWGTANTLEASSVTINSLLMSAGGHAAVVDLGGGTLTVGDGANATGGIAVAAGAKGLTLGTAPNTGTLTGGVSGVSTLGLISNNAAAADGLIVNAAIANGGAGTTRLMVSGGTGGGTVILAGANTYSGGTSVVSGATLQVGAGGDTGSLGSGPVALDAGTRLVFSRNDTGLVVSSVISGAGALTQGGMGTTTLTGANTYTGATTILAGGALRIGDGTTNGSLGTAAVSNDGTLEFMPASASSMSVNNAISGTGTVIQAGGGVTVLTGANSYGETLISGGTLQVGADGTTGTLGSGTVTTHGTLAFNRSDTITVSNAIGGAGALVQMNGAGTLVLTGNNTYGATSIAAGGTLQVGDGGASGTLGSGAVVNSGTLVFNRDGTLVVSGDISGAGTLIQSGSGVTSLTGANTSGAIRITGGTLRIATGGSLGTGSITLGGGTLDFHQSGEVSVSPAITGMGMLTQTGSGTTVLLGNNTYNGTTSIQAGTLQVGDGGTTGALGSGVVTNDALLVFKRSDTVQIATVISGNGAVRQSGTGVLVMIGNNTYTGGTRIDSGGTLQVGQGDASGGAGAGDVTNEGTLVFNRSDRVVQGAVISGSGRVVQIGTGATQLTGNNTYTGGTTVSDGALILKSTVNGGALGAFGSGDITLAGGGIGFNPGSTVNAYTVSNLIHITGDAKIANDDGATTLGGAVDIASGKTLTVGTAGFGGKTLTLAGGISGTGNLTVQANGLTLDGYATSSNGTVYPKNGCWPARMIPETIGVKPHATGRHAANRSPAG